MDVNLEELQTLKKKLEIKSMSSEFLENKSQNYATMMENLNDDLEKKVNRINELNNINSSYEKKMIKFENFIKENRLFKELETYLVDKDLTIQR